MPFNLLCFGPASLISEFDGGLNYMYLGVLSRECCAQWPLCTSTVMGIVITSTARLAEVPLGDFRTRCFIHGLVWAIDRKLWAQVSWIVDHLPDTHRLYSDNLIARILETGGVAAISYAIPVTEPKTARPMFRDAAVEAANKGQTKVAQYLCTRFTNIKICGAVVLAASARGNLEMVKWCANKMHDFPTDAIKALLINGNVDALEWLKNLGKNPLDSDRLVIYAALGGHLSALDWVLDNTMAKYDEREVCLMVGVKGLLHVLKHLIVCRGFAFNRTKCIRFAKKNSGVGAWLITTT
ncbi:unnamed protein product [Pylaiella littoralis]